MKNIHFIAIGGSAMHNLAIALHNKGNHITGSDDEIYEPSKSRLAQKGLLPKNQGWFPEKITPEIDFVILGMHARSDNPELLRAKELSIPVYSYPEFLYEHAKHKKRIVIGGSHGKTTTTAMILHVLQHYRIKVDYMIGAQLQGYDTMVSLSDESNIMVLEGDEYLTSPLDPRPKFHLYKPHTAVITGISWDHINVFPTYDIYLQQFIEFINLIEENGKLIYCQEDPEVNKIVSQASKKIQLEPYRLPQYEIKENIFYITELGKEFPLKYFGKHNLLNTQAARLVCNDIGISDTQFYDAITTFSGASGRLETLFNDDSCTVYRDFAHAPSKLSATINSVKEKSPHIPLTAVMELHTFSSLNKAFLPHYANTMNRAELRIVFFSPHTLVMKKLPNITPEEIKEFFQDDEIIVITEKERLKELLLDINKRSPQLFLLMSSGSFDGLDFNFLIPGNNL